MSLWMPWEPYATIKCAVLCATRQWRYSDCPLACLLMHHGQTLVRMLLRMSLFTRCLTEVNLAVGRICTLCTRLLSYSNTATKWEGMFDSLQNALSHRAMSIPGAVCCCHWPVSTTLLLLFTVSLPRHIPIKTADCRPSWRLCSQVQCYTCCVVCWPVIVYT